MTDVYGTYVLLEAAKELKLERYHQVSTDEVYGAGAGGLVAWRPTPSTRAAPTRPARPAAT